MVDTTAYETDAETTAPTPTDLNDVARLAAEAVELESAIAEAERVLKELSAKHRTLTQEDLPRRMAELGLAEMKMAGGGSVKVEEKVYASLPKDPVQREIGLGWLNSNGHGAIIKQEVTVAFRQEDSERVGALARSLSEQFPNATVEAKKNVHAQTLAAFVREQRRLHVDLPYGALGAYVVTQATVKMPK